MFSSGARYQLDLARRQKQARYIADREQLTAAKKEDWRWVGFDSTTGEGIVRSGNVTRRGKVITNGYLVPGQPVEFNQDGGFATIEGRQYKAPAPRRNPTYKKREELVLNAWAIAVDQTRSNATSDFYVLINLITGQTYDLQAVNKTIPPCGNVPNDAPLIASPARSPDASWYLHIWHLTIGWTSSVTRVCNDTAPPAPPTNIYSVFSGGFSNTLRTGDGRTWAYRSNTYLSSIVPGTSIGSQAIATYTQSPAPPTLPSGAGSYAVISSGLGYSNFNGYLEANGSTSPFPWVYVSGNCPPAFAPLSDPPIDFRNPNGTPIPNSVESTLSLDEAGSPIAHIRHTPNCALNGFFTAQKSYYFRNDANGTPQLRNIASELTTDWRYGAAFPCQSNFKTATHSNLELDGKTSLWTIEPADRVATLTAEQPEVLIKISKRAIAANCSTTMDVAEIDDIPAIVRTLGTQSYQVKNIAVAILE